MEKSIEYLVTGLYDSSISRLSKKTFSPKRKVERFEIELYEQSYFYTFINGEKIQIKENTMLIAKPNDVRYSKLHFKCRFIHLYTNIPHLYSALANMPRIINIFSPKEYLEIFDSVSKLSIDIEKNQYLIIAQVYKLIHLLNIDSEINNNIKDNKLKQCVNYISNGANFIEKHFTENISLQTIANSLSLSPNYFQTVFKKAYGKTPLEYLTNVRLNYAKHLLLSTELSITEIAFKCGFNNQPYFNYIFKKHNDISPMKFRLLNKKQY